MGDGRKNPTNETEQRERDVRNAVLNALRHKLTGKKVVCAGLCAITGPVVFSTSRCINCEADRVMNQVGTDPRAAVSYVNKVYENPPLEALFVRAEPCLAAGCNYPAMGGGGSYCANHSYPRVSRPGLAPPAPSLEQFRSEGWQAPLLDRAELPSEDWYYPEGSWIPVRRKASGLISNAVWQEAAEIHKLREQLATAQAALTKYMKERAPLADEAQMLRAENKTLSADCNTLRRKLEDAERKLAARGKK